MSEHPAVFNKVLAKQDDLIKLAKILHDVINELRHPDSKNYNNLFLLQESLKEIISKE